MPRSAASPPPPAPPPPALRRRVGKRTFALGVIAAVALLAVGLDGCVMSYVGGAWRYKPSAIDKRLSKGARALVKRAYRGLDGARLTDHHVHVVGVGAGNSGCEINPELQSIAHPVKHARYSVYLSACAVDDIEQADQQFVARLVDLRRNFRPYGRFHLLAFDRHYRKDGTVDPHKTEFHVPNAYVVGIAKRHPKLFTPALSIHPYRKDAVAALRKWAKQTNAKMVKWLPNAMGIDPADPRCDPFYDAMRELGLVLLTHGGLEKAVEAEDAQKLGNPLRLRRALDHGVKVIVAHCASLGEDVDLDDPEKKLVPSFDLFLRLMDDPRYKGLVFGEISALTLSNRMGRPLKTMLKRTDLHSRLVNGSDYPLPAINVLIRTGAFESEGFITAEERAQLNELYDINPLLFDFVLKRTIRHPKTGERFAPPVFMDNPGLFRP